MGHFAEHRGKVLAQQAAQQEKDAAAAEKAQARSADPGPADPGPRPEHMTPMQRHKAAVAAQRQPAAVPAPSRTTGRAAAQKAAKQVKSAMVEAIESLHGLDLAVKIERKKELVEQFRAPAEKLLEAKARNDDFSAWIVWLFDIGRIDEFSEKAPAAIALGWLTGPLGMKRSLLAFYFDSIREWSEGEFREGNSPEPYFTQAYDQRAKMQDVVQAKYDKLAGDMARKKGKLQKALEFFGLAKKANEKIGVDTRINEIEKELKAAGGAPGQSSPPAGGGPDAKESAERGSKET